MPMEWGRNGSSRFLSAAKQSFGGKLFFQLLEGQRQRALPLRLHIVDIKLQIAAHRVDAHPAETQHCHAVLRREAQHRSLAAKHHRRDLALVVFESEIEMARRRHAKVGDFALHPERIESRLQRAFDPLIEFAHGEKLAGFAGEQRQIGLFGSCDAPYCSDCNTKKKALREEGLFYRQTILAFKFTRPFSAPPA